MSVKKPKSKVKSTETKKPLKQALDKPKKSVITKVPKQKKNKGLPSDAIDASARKRKPKIKSIDEKVSLKKTVKTAQPEITAAPHKRAPRVKKVPLAKPVPPKTDVVPTHSPATIDTVPEPPTVVPSVKAPAVPEKPAISRPKLKVDETVTVSELAVKMNIKSSELIKKLMSLGVLATINQRIGTDAVILVASEFGYDIEVVPLYGEKEIVEEEDESKLKHRAPIVTIMGHVDHGKTSLMDAIRESNIVEKESGGITQHIGAYKVKIRNGEIVFLDTPGHEAFTAMRARGAQVTDIVVLVVAADDGVMPQTIEAIDHARAANVPIIVAINKIDMPAVNLQKVKQGLANQNLLPEDWGGKTITVEVSAKKRIGIDKLLEMILLQAEMMELKANYDKKAVGIIVEARVSSKKGPVATVLIKSGNIKVGDYFVAGTVSGKVRAMHNDRRKRLMEAGPSTPIEIMGFQKAPQSGDKFFVVADEKEARHISEIRQQLKRDERLSRHPHLTLEDFHKNVVEGKVKELKLIIKADVRGSVEVLRDSLEKLSTKDVVVKTIHSGIGGINNSDVILAAASDAIIIGFNVRSEISAMTVAQKEDVEIKTYRIIYEVVNEVKAALEGLLEPDKKEVYLGRAKVLRIFKAARIGTIAGCSVIDNKILRTGNARLLRDNTIIFDGKIASLKRFKDDVREVEKGFECGIVLNGFGDIKAGDLIESYNIELVKRKL
ncbi:MAG: translation initiation factor IF-2 [Elusimicrobia bacterium]|nr:translation initiation factor IF-2 [Elusimicrobiota bacterium]